MEVRRETMALRAVHTWWGVWKGKELLCPRGGALAWKAGAGRSGLMALCC